jgi:hypothetical protein
MTKAPSPRHECRPNLSQRPLRNRELVNDDALELTTIAGQDARRGAHGAGERRPLPILGFDDGLALAPQAAPPCPALTAPAAPAARRRAVLRQPHTSYSLYAGHDVVEVLTKCRVQHLSHGDVRFVDARRY